MTLICKKLELRATTRHVYMVSSFENVETAAKTEAVLGLAAPMADGSFKVTRFNTTGYSRATTALRAALARANRDSMRDTRL